VAERTAAPAGVLYARMGVCTQPFGGLGAWLAWVIDIVLGRLDAPGGLMFTRPAADLVALLTLSGETGQYDAWRSRVSNLPEFGGNLPVSALAEEMETPGAEQIRALITVAGNPALSAPNGPRIEAALGRLELMVSLDLYVNETSRHADFILPASTALEHDHYGLVFHALAVRNTARYAPPVMPKRGDTRRDGAIILELCARLHARRGLPGRVRSWGLRAMQRLGFPRLLDLLLRMGPYGAGFRPFAKGLTLSRLRAKPDGLDFGPLEPCLPARLGTPDKRIRLAPDPLVADIERLEVFLAEDTPELLLIGRRHLRSNNSWLHNVQRLVTGEDRCTVIAHPDDASARGLETGQLVELSSRTGKITAPLEIDEGIMPGVVSLPHGWGHHREGARLSVASVRPGVSFNDLTDEAFVDRLTGTAGLNALPVEMRAASVATSAKVAGDE